MSNIERIFTRGGQVQADDNDEYTAKFKALVRDSVDYEQSFLAPFRDLATKYYYGELPNLDGKDQSTTLIVDDPQATYDDLLGVDDQDTNKSTYVSTDVKDVIKAILPALIRIYAAGENVVTFTPRDETQVDIAKMASDYVNYVFWNDNPGFLILNACFKDALAVKGGWVKWWTDDTKCYEVKTYQNIDQEQFIALMQPDASGQAPTVMDHGNVDPATGLVDKVQLRHQVSKPIIKCADVAPEEMRLDRYVRTDPKDSRIIGHVRAENIDTLVNMGYDRDLLEEYITSADSTTFSDERALRNPGLDATRRIGDGVIYGEWYARMDKDGDGYAELRHICTLGQEYDIVSDEPANRIKFALFQADPVPHTIISDCVSDDVMDIQRIKTNAWRGLLDNLVDTLNPRSVVNEIMVNMEDVMNDDLGAIIRTRGDPNATVAYTQIPFVGSQLVPIIQMLDDARDRRTGVTDASKGLDPKALQSSTQIGVDAVLQGAQDRIELIARFLAETGFKDLFTGLYNEICENPNQVRTLRINKNFQRIDTGTFDPSMGVEVNPSMGKGTEAMRMMVLQGIKQDQQAIIGQYGLSNGIVGINEMLNTVEDMLDISNIRNVSRYFKRPPPEAIQAMESAPREPDPMAVAAKASYEKVKSDAAAKIGDSQQKQQQFDQTQKFKEEQLAITTAQTNRRLELEAERNVITHEQNLARNAKGAP